MTDPNQRVLWWEERIKQENKSMLKLLRARRKGEALESVGGDKDRLEKRKELARRLKETEAAVAEERTLRYRVETEARELEAVSKKAGEALLDPVVLAKARHAGGSMAATLGARK